MNLYSYLLMLVILMGTINGLLGGRKSKRKDHMKEKHESKGTKIGEMYCPDCDRLFCTVRKPSKLSCNGGGVTTDICGCCPVCAKQLGDPCGGEWNYLGKCDKGLYCKPSSHNVLTMSVDQPIRTEVPMGGIPEGTCEKPTGILQDEEGSENGKPVNNGDNKCKPKCSPDFCLANPRAICSAIDVVDMKRDCHGSCQHTSCQACSWVDPEPECGACKSDDEDCIKRFAKCIKKSYCTRSKFPCKKNVQEKDQIGKFQCMVPKCLDN